MDVPSCGSGCVAGRATSVALCPVLRSPLSTTPTMHGFCLITLLLDRDHAASAFQSALLPFHRTGRAAGSQAGLFDPGAVRYQEDNVV